MNDNHLYEDVLALKNEQYLFAYGLLYGFSSFWIILYLIYDDDAL